MIVKNESKIICRLLESVAPFIDTYCICDTGSTDDTVQVIHDYFNHLSPPIHGKIIQGPFHNFAYNRNIALQACSTIPVKWLLCLDADMVFQVVPSKTEFLKMLEEEEDVDAFCILQGTPDYYYKNIRIVKNSIDKSYVGVTHEYLQLPIDAKAKLLAKEVVFIQDIGDGGCKENKYERDLILLTQELQRDPNNPRTVFYLANTYRDIGEYENAIYMYMKRIELLGWEEEVWY